ncbi:glycosyltransferase [Microbacterium sp. 13-71-7]|jgi:glycosyltransferase involved in cell wall biosynthesis|uniref:glycosyltransferase n=1 Tax=Microbacterium sp. 13-71-7 TaxID=1970399 RepID=UPI000BCB1354|nr:glycosyltransferase [Microbacterium sp. 13-71-7]OZB82668.1 MAG: hypothetical protein B7X32_12850 [Microbacterium sp. 13-71-7]
MRALYVTPSSFRTVNAGALRNLNIANSLVREGHEVRLLIGDAPQDPIAPEWEELAENGVTISAVGGARTGRWSKLRRVLGGTPIDAEHIGWADAVVLYNPSPFQYMRVARDRRKVRRLVVDLSEWLAPSDLPGSWTSPYTWAYELFMRFLPTIVGRKGHVLAISRPMAEWIGKGGARVLVVPPLSDAEAQTADVPETATTIVLSGSGIAKHGKDAAGLSRIVRLAETEPEALRDLVFHILGAVDSPTADRIAALGGRTRFVQHGWTDWPGSVHVVKNADWLLLLRDPDVRRHRLGYPSKVTEALTLGVPVIVNRCGGTTDYLDDGVNALILDEITDVELTRVLDRARSLRLRHRDDRFRPSAWTVRLSDAVFG